MKDLNETEFIELIGKQRYSDFCTTMAVNMIQRDVFKKATKSHYLSVELYNFNIDNSKIHVLVVGVIYRDYLPKIIFAIDEMKISENKEELIDVMLDLHNSTDGGSFKTE